MQKPDGLIAIRVGDAHATVAAAGAEWRSWTVGGADLLWAPDPAFWAQTAPILFPVCGWTRGGKVRVGGRSYPLGLHGFASKMQFSVHAVGPDFVRLRLRDDETTRALYPFGFELDVEYRLSEFALSVRGEIRNCGGDPMPYAFGLHPGLRWPFAGGAAEDYSIGFDAAERPEVPVISAGGLFSAKTRSVPMQGTRLALSPHLFEREALCFLDARSQGLRFSGPGGRSIRVQTGGFDHIVLWSRPGAPFLCVESCTGYGDPEDFDGELADKPSMILLAPGEARAHVATYSLEGGAAVTS